MREAAVDGVTGGLIAAIGYAGLEGTVKDAGASWGQPGTEGRVTVAIVGVGGADGGGGGGGPGGRVRSGIARI
jgi:hypothetical protein